jgi:hypothetical protein
MQDPHHGQQHKAKQKAFDAIHNILLEHIVGLT